MATKYTFEQVRQYFKDQGCELLSAEYINTKEKLKYICNCNEKSEISFGKFKAGQRCRKCSYKKTANKIRTPYDEVKKYFESNGCILLSESFVDTSTPLDYICICKNKSKIAYSHFKNGVRCKKCANNERFTLDEARVIFKEKGMKLLEENYVNTKTKMKCICKCDEIAYLTVEAVKMGRGCVNCKRKALSGENHWLWNPELTQEERERMRLYEGYNEWRRLVFKRDNYICQYCGIESRGDIVAHHKDAHHWCIERRLDVSNGVTLHRDCHKEFHRIYSNRNNTEQQYNEWIANSKEVVLNGYKKRDT